MNTGESVFTCIEGFDQSRSVNNLVSGLEVSILMGLVGIDNGNISNLHFKFTGNDYSADGKVLLLYDGLKIFILKKDKEENKYEKKQFRNLATNLIIKNSNPGKNGAERSSQVHLKRNINKYFLNVVWKSIYAGIKETVGFK